MPSLNGPSDDEAEAPRAFQNADPPETCPLCDGSGSAGRFRLKPLPDRTVNEPSRLWDRMTALHSEQKLFLAVAHWLALGVLPNTKCGEMPDSTVLIVWNDTCLPSSELSQIGKGGPG